MNHVDASVWGALYDGLIVSSVLYGFASAQAYRYHTTYNDPLLLKSTVFAIWIFSSLQQCLFVDSLWHYLVPRPNPQIGDYVDWSITGQLVPSEMVAFFSECFFVSKIWSLSNHKKKSLLLLIPAVLAFGFDMAYIATCIRNPAFVDQAKEELQWLVGLLAIARTITDIGIALSTCWLAQNEHPFQYLDQSSSWWIFRIVNYLLATGLLNSIFTVTCTVLFFAMPQNMAAYHGVHLAHGKIYFNSMLVSLNNRKPPQKHEGVRFITNSDFT